MSKTEVSKGSLFNAPNRVIIAPSVLAADFSRLAEEIAAVEAAGADWIHLDIMDGHFVPNLTFGAPVVKMLRKCTKLPFDAHLMVTHPEHMIDAFADAGCDYITVHVENTVHLHRVLSAIRARGVKAGVALNPATLPETITYIAPLIDLVLVMSVNPGFGGQLFVPEVLSKIQWLKELSLKNQHNFKIAVDGGIDPQTIGQVAKAGATIFVAGSAIFGAKDYCTAVQAMRNAAAVVLSNISA
jgi:ribulose-phosphate 3-epimerase